MYLKYFWWNKNIRMGSFFLPYPVYANFKRGSVVAANRNQSPCVEVRAKYSTNHVRGEEQAENAAESSAIQCIEV